MKRAFFVAFVAAAALLIISLLPCEAQTINNTTNNTTGQNAERFRKLYNERCSSCHNMAQNDPTDDQIIPKASKMTIDTRELADEAILDRIEKFCFDLKPQEQKEFLAYIRSLEENTKK